MTTLTKMRPAILIAALFLAGFTTLFNWQRNWTALAILNGLQQPDMALLLAGEQALKTQADDSCGAYWLLARLYDLGNEADKRDDMLARVLSCSGFYLPLARSVAADNFALAALAVEKYPERGDAWFWLADLTLPDSPEQAVRLYWQGLQRQPNAAQVWVQLGRVMVALDSELAVQLYEEFDLDRLPSADARFQVEMQFIMATILAATDPSRAIELYQDGLQRSPRDGVRWYELGHLLADVDVEAALEAYARSCRYGDPGSHGCYGAGRMAERQGDVFLAIEYYRQSRWAGAQERADQLEQALP
jgi:tetratricopeptide (TPR) repeat protein